MLRNSQYVGKKLLKNSGLIFYKNRSNAIQQMVLSEVSILASGLAIRIMPNSKYHNIITNKKSFSTKVLKAPGLQVVQFYAHWSGPCHIMAPVFKALSTDYKLKANFVLIDIELYPLAKREFGIIDLPTTLFYSHGVLVDFISGMISKNDLINKFESLINNTTSYSLTNSKIDYEHKK